METAKKFRHIGLIGAGPGISVYEKYLLLKRKQADSPLPIFRSPEISYEKKQMMLGDCTGRTMQIIEPAEIEWISCNRKIPGFIKNRKQFGKNKKKVNIQCLFPDT